MKNESLIERAQYAIDHPDVLHTSAAHREIIVALLEQHDELLAVLESVVKCCDEPRSRDNSEHDGITALEAARTIIAKVKRGTA